MSPSSAKWGIPDYGHTLDRQRVTGAIAALGDRPTILFGTSGCGKSVAAAQYAEGCGKAVVWIDACGQRPSLIHVVEAVLNVLDSDASPIGDHLWAVEPQVRDMVDWLATALRVVGEAAGLCLVIDNVGPISADEVLGLHLMARSLMVQSCRIVVTTCSLDGWPSDVLRDWEIIGSDDLSLTVAEASSLLAINSGETASDEASRLRDASRGHVALFSVLSVQARIHGLESAVRRTPTLDAWLETLLFSQMSETHLLVLLSAALLKNGTERDLAGLGLHGVPSILADISEILPLVSTGRGSEREPTFRVHDLIDGFWADRWGSLDPSLRRRVREFALPVLTTRGDLSRAAEVLLRDGDQDRSIRWLTESGSDMLDAGLYAQLSMLLSTAPIAVLMAKPHLLLLWADLCAETGHLDDALSKAKAARPLAQHMGDSLTASTALARSLLYLRRMNRLDEADSEANRILATPSIDPLLTAEALFCVGHNAALRGEWDAAQPALESALGLADPDSRGARLQWAARQVLAMLPAIARGDFVMTSRALSPMIAGHRHLLCFRTALRGNLSVCLLELGRITRCLGLLASVLDDAERWGLLEYQGAYLPVLGCAKIGDGDTAVGLDLMRRGISYSVSAGDESGADQSRVYLAVVLRAAGHFDESLCEAERAFERLSVADSMNFRRLAALEVAASLLALGDLSAARSWVGTVLDEGFSGNLYHALRADMILAEIDRLEGRRDDAVARLRLHTDYVISENPNWQIAMYCRAFPALIGLFALAVGVEHLPSHLLRMILPEHAERCLGATHELLDSVTWRRLGVRLLGEEELEGYLRRDGLPLCHVRLFGGLDINVGGRNVRERDWKKRKARLLFAMLVIRRGQDVARDQLFDYLWPEMEEERAKNNLYVVWSAMKSVLMGKGEHSGKCPYVESVGGVCRSVRETVRTDVDDFQAAIVAARDAETAKIPVDALRAYERIADLYRGDLLPGDCYDDWFANLREHYRSEFVDAMLRGTQLLVDADDPGNALIFARRAIQCDPFREDLYQAALRCQIAAGQRSSAIDTYLQCRDKLADELGLDPSVETRALYDDILAMEDKPRPTPIDPFVG